MPQGKQKERSMLSNEDRDAENQELECRDTPVIPISQLPWAIKYGEHQLHFIVADISILYDNVTLAVKRWKLWER